MIALLSKSLRDLRGHFLLAGFDLRLVGGCVRDWYISGHISNDIDLCTDADPVEQQAIYEANGVRHIATGLSHGTWTVVLDRPYEITSLRTETCHDGRHAKVAWSKDWLADLSRRDLTINAMAMTFDGDVIDPFDGRDDLDARLVRFVGNPVDRMQEDYLRILRFFRFVGRFGTGDPEAYAAAKQCAPGLEKISRERIWSEIAKIISGSPKLLADLIGHGVHRHIGLPERSATNILEVIIAHHDTQDPASLMGLYLGSESAVYALAAAWKWSNDDRNQAAFIAGHQTITLQSAKACLAVDGVPKYWVTEALRIAMQGGDVPEIVAWTVPTFPVAGADLLGLGLVGKEVGKALTSLKHLWESSKFKLDREQLLGTLQRSN